MRALLSVLSSASLAIAQAPLAVELVASGFDSPVLVTAPPGDLHRLFVVEKPGRIRIVDNGAVSPTPFLDLTGTGLVQSGGEAGLLGLAFHPDHAQNGVFFVFRTAAPYLTAYVDRLQVSAADPNVADLGSRVTLLQQLKPYGNHNGGTLAFGPDGYLYVTLGDGGSTGPLWPNDPFNHAQNGQSLLGKILRIDVDQPAPPLLYGIPPDNPFVGSSTFRPEIWAYGLRNPWRCAFDRLTGDLWIADVGGRNEEVDLQLAGAPGGRNYGWSCMAGTWCNNLPVCTCFDAALTMPLHEYQLAGSQAIIGGHVYRGTAIPALRGSYLFADYPTRQFWSLEPGAATATLVDRTAELAPPAPFTALVPSAFGEDGAGELYVCDLGGHVWRIVSAAPPLAGVTPFGLGTAGCSGPHALAAESSPTIGNASFALGCGNAPPGSVGLLAFSSGVDVAGSDLLGAGLRVHVQIAAPFFVLEAMPVDAQGAARFAFAIPPAAGLVGIVLHTQAVFGWAPAVCAPSALGWSSSSGLTLTLQP
ncbi:MAG: PQQ-dependent sugar dehydrogenase [Planctomycetes bacterium]|nr:PQQ-dependent sugar dehydrogenase [Planctomycetota bacterium]